MLKGRELIVDAGDSDRVRYLDHGCRHVVLKCPLGPQDFQLVSSFVVVTLRI
jgi:hypothetical protein